MAQLKKLVRVGSDAPKVTSQGAGTYQDNNVVRTAPKMSEEDSRKLEDAKQAWELGNRTGNKVVMDTAHRQAEAIRAKYGFSGGNDGAQVIPLNGSVAAGDVSAASIARAPTFNGTATSPLSASPAAQTAQQAAESVKQKLTSPANSTMSQDNYNIVQRMRANGDAWNATQDTAERQRLAAENERLAAQYFPGAYKVNGVWYYNGAPLYEMDYQAPTVEAPAMDYGTAEGNERLTALANELQAARQAAAQAQYTTPEADLSEERTALERAAAALNGAERPYVGADLSGERAEADAAARAVAERAPFAYQGTDLSALEAALDAARQNAAADIPDIALADLSAQRAALDAAAAAVTGQDPFSWQGRDLSDLEGRVQAASDRITGRDAFSYDPNADPAYRAYERIYTNKGRRAMEDTIGQLAARTGGYASSWAGSMGQQAYGNYMQELAAQIPALQQAAYQMYVGNLAQERADYEMLAGQLQSARAADREAREDAWQQYINRQDLAKFGYDAALNRYSSDLAQANTDRDLALRMAAARQDNAWRNYSALQDRYDTAREQNNLDRSQAWSEYLNAGDRAQWWAANRQGQYESALDQSNLDRNYAAQQARYRRADNEYNYSAALQALQQAAAQAADSRDFSYRVFGDNRDALQQTYANLANEYATALGQYNTDRGFDFDVDQFRSAMDQWNAQRQYEAERDSIADRVRADETAYNRGQDALDRAYQEAQAAEDRRRYDQEWDYGVGRDQIEDQRYATEWAHNVSQDEVDNALRWAALELDRQQYGLSLDKFNYQQAQDAFDNSLAQQKFTYSQSQDAITNAQAAQRLAMQQAEADAKAQAAQQNAAAEARQKAAEAIAELAKKKAASVLKKNK